MRDVFPENGGNRIEVSFVFIEYLKYEWNLMMIASQMVSQ